MDAWLAGVMIGDGTCHYGKNKAYAVWIDQHERNRRVLDGVQQKLKLSGFKIYRYKVPANKARVLTYSKALYLEFLSIRENSAKFFSGLNDSDKKEFIAGFFDAEGTMTDRIVIYNSDIRLLKAIQVFLQQIGIPSFIYEFGKIHGLQVYRKLHKDIFFKEIKAIRLSRRTG